MTSDTDGQVGLSWFTLRSSYQVKRDVNGRDMPSRKPPFVLPRLHRWTDTTCTET